MCRVVYKRDGRPECWIITNKHNFTNESIEINQRVCTAISIKDSCSAVYAKTGKYLEQTLPYVKDLLAFVENNCKIKFEEFVADFIKDS